MDENEKTLASKPRLLYNCQMAKKGGARITVGLTCTVCKNRNYVTTRNKLNTQEKLSLTKFCKFCRKKTPHKEVEKLK